jgi:hypothetical protein
MQALTSLLYLAPLLILQGGSSLRAFTTEQLQALALMFLKVNAYAFNIDLVFFGLWCILTGYLIFRSTFLPRVLGVLLAISGLGLVTYLYPPLAYHLFFPLHRCCLRPRGNTDGAMAHRDGPECATMEGASQRGSIRKLAEGVGNNAIAIISFSRQCWRVSDVRWCRRNVLRQRFLLAWQGGRRLRRIDADHGGSCLMPGVYETPNEQCIRRPSNDLYGGDGMGNG